MSVDQKTMNWPARHRHGLGLVGFPVGIFLDLAPVVAEEAAQHAVHFFLVDAAGIVVHALALVEVHAALRARDELKAAGFFARLGQRHPRGERAAEIRAVRPDDVRHAVAAAERVGLVPIGALVAGILGEELAAPADHVGAEDARHPVYDLGPADELREEVVVEVTVVVVDAGARLGVGIGNVAAVEELQGLAFPARLHLVRFEQRERTEVTLRVEIGQLVSGQEKITRLHLCRHYTPPISSKALCAMSLIVAPFTTMAVGRSAPTRSESLVTTAMSDSDVPPSSKKSSSNPISAGASSPKTSVHIVRSASSVSDKLIPDSSAGAVLLVLIGPVPFECGSPASRWSRSRRDRRRPARRRSASERARGSPRRRVRSHRRRRGFR